MGRRGKSKSTLLEKIDVAYSYGVSTRLAAFRTNEKLGYRTAGSAAEHAAGDYLAKEMESIGLSGVVKEAFPVDSWTFHHAELTFAAAEGPRRAVLGGYQTQLVTGGQREYSMIYAGRGTRGDLRGVDVKGKLVLIDIDQRNDWWISFPAYEAHRAGAVAVIAAQRGGYAEVSPDALNAQDICGPADAPAFSISQRDFTALRTAIEAAGGETSVLLDADSCVSTGGVSYNITGAIAGKSDRMILISAHYDAYFEGFQDNSAAVGLMMGIAKAVKDSGYRPDKTVVFCALAAEEWGSGDCRYDWSTGAYNQVFRLHPEWAEKTIANINFELPGYDMNYPTDQIRASYELKSFLEEFAAELPTGGPVFPDGVEVITPTQTWSDDFSFSIAGIPATVTALREDFAALRYHTQFDDATTYNEGAYRYHHALYCKLLLAYDRCALPPLDFSWRFARLNRSVDTEVMEACGADAGALLVAASEAAKAARDAYSVVRRVNRGREAAASLFHELLAVFKLAQDELVHITWYYEAVFPHENLMRNIAMLLSAADALKRGDAEAALREYLWAIDNNWYAYHFSEETYRHFTDSAMNRPDERQFWGAGRMSGHVDLYDVIRSLLERGARKTDYSRQIEALQSAMERQKALLVDLVEREKRALIYLAERLRRISDR